MIYLNFVHHWVVVLIVTPVLIFCNPDPPVFGPLPNLELIC